MKGVGGIVVYVRKSISHSDTQIDLNDSNELISLILNLANDIKVGFIAACRSLHIENEYGYLVGL